MIDQGADLSTLSVEQKRALLAKLLAEKAKPPRKAPVSFTQQRLWLLDQLEPDNAAYNIPVALRLSGELDTIALEKTLNQIVRRHESLRTVFAIENDDPIQIVQPSHTITLLVSDAVDLSEARFRQSLAAEARKPFDLSRGPLYRVVLFRRSEREFVLLFVMHHIVSDGWSVGVLIKEMAAIYGAFAVGEPSPLPELPIQYADYAAWQRTQLSGQRLEDLLAYWREQLKNLTTLELPTDRPRPTTAASNGSREKLELPAEIVGQIGELARRENLTPFMIYLAAFQTLLHRYSNQDDIVVGSPIANRNRSETEGLIGFFANTLVLRSDLSGDPTFRELLARVRKTTIAAFDHQDAPFESLVEALNPPRDPSRNPLFQVAIAMQNIPREKVTLPGLTMSREFGDVDTAKFDLSLSIMRARTQPRLVLEYCTDLYDAATIQRMLAHFEVLLHGAIANPDCRLSDLPLLPADERRLLLIDFNNTKADYDLNRCLHEWIEQQVKQTPEAVAVRFEGDQWTYRELNERANRLAHRLRALGVEAETRVGVCMERSLELVQALLAILKAGGAYVPLDPEYPRERLAHMLEDAQTPLLLTQRRLRDIVPEFAGQVLCLDEFGGELATEPAVNPEPIGSASSLAYVIFTSGSTGRPKGAMNEHRGIVNRLLWMQAHFGLTPADRVLQKTPFSFDVSVWEFFWPLMTGAQLVMARPGGHRDPGYLVETILRERITTLHFVPSMLQVFLEELNAGTCGGVLRRVICSGEALPLVLQQRFFERMPGPQLHNLYGPTEAAVDVTYWQCDPSYERTAVPIGRPVANTQMYVLDKRGEPTPLGVPGELHIGGVQVGRGYLNRVELTAEKFVPDPFSNVPTARLYRTGDLARWLPDGVIDYLGRLDFQVKIRGFRIELGEIEAVLARHPQVREAAVLAREDSPGDKRLAAYLVAKDGPVAAADLAAFAGQRLPDYMVPSAYVFLPALPLSPNGKLDRKALPAPTLSRDDLADQYVAPRTPYEEQLAAIWAGVLNRTEPVGANDNFFELGGHSLLVARVVNKISTAFNVQVTIRAVFENPTPSRLATWIEEQKRGANTAPLLLRRRDEPLSHIPLTSTQERMYFVVKSEPNAPTFNCSIESILTGELDIPALTRAANEVIRRHQGLRMSFPIVDDTVVQQPHPYEPFEIPFVDVSYLAENEREKALHGYRHATRWKRYDFDNGPLFRFKLIRLAPQEHALVFGVHHMVWDGTSRGVFAREMAALYRAFSRGLPSPLPELQYQYSDYVLWLQDTINRQDMERVKAYALKHTATQQPLELATDFPRPQRAITRSFSIPIEFPDELAAAIRGFRSKNGITPYMTLLAALEVVLHIYSGQDHIRVSTPTANRNPVETDEMIGCFTKVFLQNNDLSGNPTFATLVERIRNDVLEAYENQIMPVSMLKKLGKDNRPDDLRRGGNMEVMFMMQNFDKGASVLNRGASQRTAEGLVIGPMRERAKGPVEMLAPQRREGAEAGVRIGPDLVLELTEKNGAFGGHLAYRPDLFRQETAERIRRYFLAVLQHGIAAPDTPFADLPIIDEEEKHWLLTRNRSLPATAGGQWAHQVIEKNALENPRAIAVVWGNKRLTYAELNRRANSLAHYLKRRGIQPGKPVGICVERSLDMVVAVLGVLKAGAAFMPIDPESSSSRIGFMLKDSNAAGVLTHAALRGAFADSGIPVIELDTDSAAIGRERADAPPDLLLHPEAPAYVIYTSGSTGEPKGVVVAHRSLSNAYDAWEHEYQLRERTRCHLQMANFTFDVFTGDFTRALCSGGKLVLCPREFLAEPARLYELMRNEKVDAAEFVPVVILALMKYLQGTLLRATFKKFEGGMAAFEWAGKEVTYRVSTEAKVQTKRHGEVRLVKIVERLNEGATGFITVEDGVITNIGKGAVSHAKRLDFMRLVVVGSDAWYVGQHQALKKLCSPETRVINSYGLTETTIDSSYFDGDTSGLPLRSMTPIGRPFPNTEMYVLDRRGRLSPPGVWGELYIGGPGVALGYLQRPDLNAERFVANPYHPAGARVYKTGDWARWRQDGNLEFNGRLDGQVKINGLRIEAGEIEQALRGLPEVRDAAVVARKDPQEGKSRLVAYFVPSVDDAHLANRLRFSLARNSTLPRYMLPSLFVPLPALPLTPSGKLDRQALPKPDTAALTRKDYIPPATPMQERLCSIWAELMGVQRVGINDDFFALGGDSMKAMQIVLRARKEFEIEDLKITALFDAPSVLELAELITRVKAKAEAAREYSDGEHVIGVFKKFSAGRIVIEIDGLESTYPIDPAAKVKTKKGLITLAKAAKKLEVGRRKSFIIRNDTIVMIGKPNAEPESTFAESLDNLGVTHDRAKLKADRLPLVAMNAGGTSAAPLFLVHGKDGGVRGFSSLATEFQSLDRPVFGLQARGFQDDGVPFERLEEMAAHYCAAIRAAQPQGPYLIGGWSAGGLVAMEVMRQLSPGGEEPGLLMLFDPWLPTSKSKAAIAKLLSQDDTASIPMAFPAIFRRLGVSMKRYMAMSSAERLKLINARMGRGMNVSGIDMAALNAMLRTARANFRALLAYTPPRYLNRTLFLRSSDRSLSTAILPAMPIAPWDELCPKTVAFSLPGTHLSMLLNTKNAKRLAEWLSRLFAKIESSSVNISSWETKTIATVLDQ